MHQKLLFEQLINKDLGQVDQYLYDCDGTRLPAHLPKYGTTPIIKIKQRSLINNQSINLSTERFLDIVLKVILKSI
jgi:hypothetical protein